MLISPIKRLARRRPGSLVIGTLHTGGWYAVRIALQTGSLILLARSLGAEGYGALAGTVALYVTFAQFAGLGSGTALVRHLARAGELYAKLVATQRVHFLTSLLLFAIVWPLSAWVLEGVLPVRTLGWLAAAELIVAPTLLPLAYRYQAEERMQMAGAMLTVSSLARFLAVLSMVWSGHHDVSTFAAFHFGWLAVATSGTLILLWPRNHGIAQRLSLWTTLKEGIPYVLSYTFSTAGGELDKTILLRSAGSFVTGQYAAAYRIMQAATLPVSSLILAATARMFRSSGDEVGKFGRTLFLATLVYALFASTALALFAPLIELLLGASFSASEGILRALCFIVVTNCVRQLTVARLTTADLQKSCNVIEFVALCILLSLLLLLVPSMGSTGAIIALGATDTTVIALGTFRLRRRT